MLDIALTQFNFQRSIQAGSRAILGALDSIKAPSPEAVPTIDMIRSTLLPIASLSASVFTGGVPGYPRPEVAEALLNAADLFKAMPRYAELARLSKTTGVQFGQVAMSIGLQICRGENSEAARTILALPHQPGAILKKTVAESPGGFVGMVKRCLEASKDPYCHAAARLVDRIGVNEVGA